MSSAPPLFRVPYIRACLFDMDGLLIDSEDKYTICTNRVLAEFDRPPLPWHIKAKLQGRPGPEAGRIFFDWAQLPIEPKKVMEKVSAHQKQVFPTCAPLPGVKDLLTRLSTARTDDDDDEKIELALATSSHTVNFNLKTSHLESELFHFFPAENRVLGDDKRIGPGRGKPAPDIWLVALETINERLRKEGKKEIQKNECLVFEDSVPGVESGRRAGMQVVWVPHDGLYQEYRGRIDQVLAGRMGEFNDSDVAGGLGGSPGELDDGFGKYVPTLEQFPLERYGMHSIS